MNIDKQVIATRKAKLETISKQLKSEFFGLDLIIDKVISSVHAWYVFPELISRPVIVNLWGMTGVGKTQLVRRLSSLLGYGQKFVEIQMDGTSGGLKGDSICSLLSSCIDEGEQGILLLDEIQRFRTVAEDGTDVKVERYQDIWALLSDGKFAADASIFLDLEMMLASRAYNAEHWGAKTDEAKEKEKAVKFKLYPYDAKMLKMMLRLPDSIKEIMTWEASKIERLLEQVKDQKQEWQIDYTQLLIFVSGNLDAAFTGAVVTEDCDTDADYYHLITSKLTSVDIKAALNKRFKPEQIARLGSNHVIYPSMSKASYYQLIKATCKKYIDEMCQLTGFSFDVNESVYTDLYNNAVFPTQGTRPVFSAVHKIFSTGLVNTACWCLETGVRSVELTIDGTNQLMIAREKFSGKTFSTSIDLEISTRKAKKTADIRTMIAVHEGGHAIVYALLTKAAPFEAKINAISFAQGYVLPADSLTHDSVVTKTSLRDRIAIALAGMAAEEIVFGPDARSTGCRGDLITATGDAAKYVRAYGYDGTISNIDVQPNPGYFYNTSVEQTNDIIEQLLKAELDRTKQLLTNNLAFFREIVDALLKLDEIKQDQFIELASKYVKLGKTPHIFEFAKQYKNFFAK